jgi:hypothetical protein
VKIFLGMTMFIALCSSFARAEGPERVATIKTFEVSKNWKDLSDLSQGLVQVDDHKVLLTLMHVDGSVADVEVTLPIIEKTLNKCGVKVIKAYRDRSALDGPKESLTVEDFSSYSCAEVGPIPATRITYEETGGWTPRVYRAQFDATTLK